MKPDRTNLIRRLYGIPFRYLTPGDAQKGRQRGAPGYQHKEIEARHRCKELGLSAARAIQRIASDDVSQPAKEARADRINKHQQNSFGSPYSGNRDEKARYPNCRESGEASTDKSDHGEFESNPDYHDRGAPVINPADIAALWAVPRPWPLRAVISGIIPAQVRARVPQPSCAAQSPQGLGAF